MIHHKGSWILAVLVAIWLFCIAAGLEVLFNYENSPGREGPAVVDWPSTTRILRDSAHSTLIMFAHPQCPCTRASLGELNLLMTHCQGRVTAHVVFFKPEEFTADWTKTDLWRSAEAIPGVRVRVDEGGVESELFHAQTSGFTVLYDTQGRLLFRGGITSARGHSGDNAGRAALQALIRGDSADQTHTRVFGCSLLD
jgi:hypothetical protein